MPADLSDKHLITKLQSGDLDALGILYERHKTRVYRTALAITRDPAAAEDILQDCFLRVHKYAYSIDSSLSLEPWLYRTTANLSYNWEKKRKRWRPSLDGMMDWLAGSTHHSPERQAEVNDVQREVIDAISSLKINQRIVVVLFYLNSLNLKEIALILNLPVGTVKSRLHYGRENLRRALETKRPAPAEMIYAFA